MPVSKKAVSWILVLMLLFLGGVAGGYLYFSTKYGPKHAVEEPGRELTRQDDDLSSVRIYYPSEGRLLMEERRIKRQHSMIASSEAVVEEFLKGPSQVARSEIPKDTKLLGIFAGNDGILYIDLSDEFRRNFQGDALSEFLLLRGLYESIISNIQGTDDVKVVIEGKEIESLGGHISILVPLKNTVLEQKG